MENINVWTILALISIVSLLFFWRRRNAVWGGFTVGIIAGLVISLFVMFKGNGFNWFMVGKATIVGIMTGLAAELLGKISNFLKNK